MKGAGIGKEFIDLPGYSSSFTQDKAGKNRLMRVRQVSLKKAENIMFYRKNYSGDKKIPSFLFQKRNFRVVLQVHACENLFRVQIFPVVKSTRIFRGRR